MKRVFLVLGIGALLSLAGCVTTTVKTTAVPALETYQSTLSSNEVLDVAVAVFDPGIADVDIGDGVFPEIRRAESTFIARELSQVLDNQGVWGASRVVPNSDHIADILVSGTILNSDGESLSLAVTARDAQGRLWLDKTYEGNTSRYAYQQTQRVKTDPFLVVYRQIANDLLAVFRDLTPQERIRIRQVAQLAFAQGFAPDAYSDYLVRNESGLITIRRLPADNDPMMQRIQSIRQRNDIFIDTLQGHYDNFSGSMTGPYNEWRRLSYDETIAERELKAEAQAQLLAGGAAVIAGIAAASSSGRNDRTMRTAGAVGIWAGGTLIKSGLQRRAEASMHSAALEELGQSLEADITPQVIELEDRTVQLSGTVEDQYAQWREILADIYATEIADLPENAPVNVPPSD
ncbi:MAG: hypothetical protein CNF01_00980 [Halieaceae bacterium MED-G27]|jgi:hypothetical protein|nr:hypothetical protein [Halieaceae bacterium]OUT65303.1 MAG: hypothetical protein CBB81_07325 [Cellvibrionales bacterium TMED21]PDH38587.1 MAG: hypothetical protein CNF01_00980 [Halieaceae bacterium MED-G27]|tara:strand:+ start:25835 stop:27046 length:1212 start_codon:yes stop_codon:yes gene_type:complete